MRKHGLSEWKHHRPALVEPFAHSEAGPKRRCDARDPALVGWSPTRRKAVSGRQRDSGNVRRGDPTFVEKPTRGPESVAVGDQVEHLRIPSRNRQWELRPTSQALPGVRLGNNGFGANLETKP